MFKLKLILVVHLFIYLLLQELDDPLILIHDKKVSNLRSLVKVLEFALQVFLLLACLFLFCYGSSIAN